MGLSGTSEVYEEGSDTVFEGSIADQELRGSIKD